LQMRINQWLFRKARGPIRCTFTMVIKFLFSTHKTVPVKSIIYDSIALFSLKTLYPGGIRTRVFCSWGGIKTTSRGMSTSFFGVSYDS
jgi:hypothetical protein